MSLVIVGLQVVLSLVLVVAGVAKLLDLSGSRNAVREFGVPERFSDVLGTVLPVAEIVLAIGLIPGASARWAALGAGGLFLLFVVVIGWNASRGRHPDCHCFGQLQSSPAGWSTVIRNAGLALGAGIVVWQGGRNPFGEVGNLSAAGLVGLLLGIVTIGVLVSLVWLMLQLWQQNGRLLLRVEALEAAATVSGAQTNGSSGKHVPVRVAPNFDLPTVDGGRFTFGDVNNAPRPTLLVFTDPSCGPCNRLLPDVGRWQREHGEALRVAVISRGSIDTNIVKSQKHGLSTIAIQEDREVAKAFGVNGTPAAVLVHPDGTMRDPVAAGAVAIRALVARVAGEDRPAAIPMQRAMPHTNGQGAQASSHHQGPKRPGAGDPVPQFSLPDLDGALVTSGDLHGRNTVLLFWNPGCGFCQRMLPELKLWEQERTDETPGLLLVSSGTVAANRNMNLQSRVVIDDGFNVGREFGASGTPSAVLIADGRIASPLVVGAPAVIELLETTSPKTTSQLVVG